MSKRYKRSMQVRHAIVDADDFLWDVLSLTLGVVRSTLGCRAALSDCLRSPPSGNTNMNDAADNTMNTDDQTAKSCDKAFFANPSAPVGHLEIARRLIDNASVEGDHSKNSEVFLEKLQRHRELVKPRIGSSRFISNLKEVETDWVIVLCTSCELLSIPEEHCDDEVVASGVLHKWWPHPTASSTNQESESAPDSDSFIRILHLNKAAKGILSQLPVECMPSNSVVFSRRESFRQLFVSDKGSFQCATSKSSASALPQSLEDIDWCQLGEEWDKETQKDLQKYTYPFRVKPLENFCESCVGRAPIGEYLCWRRTSTWAVNDRFWLEGVVVSGFSRGSSELGIPTANLEINCCGWAQPDASRKEFSVTQLVPGIYFGWIKFVKLSDGLAAEQLEFLHRMVMSIGYNPYYKNATMTLEPHLFDYSGINFNGSSLRLEIVGMLRPEADFAKFEHLVQAIQFDCEMARAALSRKHARPVTFKPPAAQ